MNEEKDILIDSFRHRLKDHEQLVERDVWAEIERDLQKKRKTIFLFNWKTAGAVAIAASFALLIGINLFVGKDVVHEAKEISKSHQHEEMNRPAEKTPVPNNTLYRATYLAKEENQPEENQPEENFNSAVKTSVVENEENVTRNTYHSYNESQTRLSENEGSKDISANRENILKLSENNNKSSNRVFSKKKKEGQLALALVTGSGGSAPAFSETSKRIEMETMVDIGTAAPPEIYDLITTNYTQMDIEYNTPISVGLLLQKNISDRWALETGLLYTYLSSVETYQLQTEQTKVMDNNSHMLLSQTSVKKLKYALHYIGIPAKITFSFLNKNNLSLYASAGGMGEMCVQGKVTETTSNESKQLNINQLQWSVLGNIGVNYKLIEHIGLFVEPGVVYYFNDGSQVNTIRKEKPFNFNLQAGIRLNF
ncbi:MAG: PorT family protein [Prevotellaceae bacterium]|jgi:hypothetical protein|nr:PorT family protein [Prevotellaceae bacterium]